MKRSTHASFVCVSAVALMLLALALTMPVHHALAAPSEQGHIAELEARIVRLEERIHKLEQLFRETTSQYSKQDTKRTPLPTLGDWRVKENWLRIKVGMSFDQAVQILGRPTRQDMIGPDQGTWYYEGHLDEAGTTVSGNIFFSSRKVLLVQPPVY